MKKKENPRLKHLAFRANSDEHLSLKLQAHKEGLTLSQFYRKKLGLSDEVE